MPPTSAVSRHPFGIRLRPDFYLTVPHGLAPALEQHLKSNQTDHGAMLLMALTVTLWGVSWIVMKHLVAFIGRSEEHTSELQSLMRISYAVFCLKKKNKKQTH